MARLSGAVARTGRCPLPLGGLDAAWLLGDANRAGEIRALKIGRAHV